MDFAVKAFTAGCLCVQGWIAWAYPEAMMLASVPTFGAMIMCEALLQKKAPAPEKQAAYTVEEDVIFDGGWLVPDSRWGGRCGRRNEYGVHMGMGTAGESRFNQ